MRIVDIDNPGVSNEKIGLTFKLDNLPHYFREPYAKLLKDAGDFLAAEIVLGQRAVREKIKPPTAKRVRQNRGKAEKRKQKRQKELRDKQAKRANKSRAK